MLVIKWYYTEYQKIRFITPPKKKHLFLGTFSVLFVCLLVCLLYLNDVKLLRKWLKAYEDLAALLTTKRGSEHFGDF